MQSVQRHFGKLRRKASTDDAQVTALVQEYTDVENAITKIVEDARLLQKSWQDMAVFQMGIAAAYQTLYEPVPGSAEEGQGRNPPRDLNEQQLEQATSLHKAYADLKDELVGEVAAIEGQLLNPATDVKNMIQPIHKTIKKRENKRVDLGNAQEKAKKMESKQNRSVKEETQMMKLQDEVAHLSEEFEIADSHLRSVLPPLIQATYKIMPYLLANLISIQNRLWGLCYTLLHEFCEANGFPSPAPHMDDIVAAWNQAFQPAAQEADSLASVRKFAALNPKTGLDRPAIGRTSTSSLSTRTEGGPPKISSKPSWSRQSSVQSPPEIQEYGSAPASSYRNEAPSSSTSALSVPTDFTSATVLGGQRSSSPGSVSPAAQRREYFSQAAVQAKRKPPPPPPGPKPGAKKAEYVIALYDFEGQGSGDLSFAAGDKIRIITKTDTDQDWWEGETGGVKGSFPANYCKPA